MLKEWMSSLQNIKKIIGNEDEWKKTQGQTMHMMGGRS
jgi:hypothetical protein